MNTGTVDFNQRCGMTRTTHVCAGCHAKLRTKDDLRKEPGAVYAKWNCGVCGTRVPATVAEKIKHQQR